MIIKTEKENRLIRKLRQELGPCIINALDDPNVIEIMLNPDGKLWIERLGDGMKQEGEIPPLQAESAMSTIATALGTPLNHTKPILQGELTLDGSRFEGLLPPIVSKPTFTIRKKAIKLFTLDDYLNTNVITKPQKDTIQNAIKDRKNILVVGGTGSGKTTLSNAIIHEIVHQYPDHRLTIIEDTSEIQCSAKNTVTLRSTDTITTNHLLKATLRLRPDRIIIGEVRGGEALSLLKAWNTGHPGGVATIHANSAGAGLIRMEQLIGEITPTPMQALIAEAVNLVIEISKTPKSREIKDIINVTGYKNGEYITQKTNRKRRQS